MLNCNFTPSPVFNIFLFCPVPTLLVGTNWNISGRAGNSPGHLGIVSFLHTIHIKEINTLPMLFGFFYFYYLLIVLASCKMYFVIALTHRVVASKRISYFSNSTWHALKETKQDAFWAEGRGRGRWIGCNTVSK